MSDNPTAYDAPPRNVPGNPQSDALAALVDALDVPAVRVALVDSLDAFIDGLGAYTPPRKEANRA